MSNKNRQSTRIKLLSEMMIEELEDYLDKQHKYDEWQKANPRNYNDHPDAPNAASLKRIMLLVRKETLKMEKLI